MVVLCACKACRGLMVGLMLTIALLACRGGPSATPTESTGAPVGLIVVESGQNAGWATLGSETVPPQPPTRILERTTASRPPRATRSPSPTSTATPTRTATPTPSPTPVPSATPTPSPAALPTPKATPTSVAEVRSIGQIGWDDIGQVITIVGATVIDNWWTSGGANLRLSDGKDTIVLFVYQDDYERLSLGLRYNLVQGTLLSVTGEISDWQGALEVVPRAEADIQLLAVPPRPPLEERAIADISPADEGRWFIVRARLGVVQPFSKGTRLLVEDGTGQIVVLLWQNVYEHVADRSRLVPGVSVQVLGEFDIWVEGGNQFEIVPHAGADVQVAE